MARQIRHNGRTYTPEQAEQKLRELDDAVIRQRKIVWEWARAQLNVHQPYVSGAVDVSICPPEHMREKWLDRVEKNLFCVECSTPWPCPRITVLRDLRDHADHLVDLKPQIEAMVPRREGYINTAI